MDRTWSWLAGSCAGLAIAAGAACAEPADGAALSLDRAVERALEHNPAYLGLADELALAGLDIEKTRSAFRTRLYTTMNSDARTGTEVGSTYRLGMARQTLSGSRWSLGFANSAFGDDYLSEVNLTYTLPFFRDPLDTGEFVLADAELAYRDRERMAAIGREEVVLQTIDTYYQAALAKNSLAVTEGGMALAARLREATRVRHRTGRSSDLDLRLAQLRVEQAEQRHRAALWGETRATDRLRMVLGMDLDEPLDVDPEIPAGSDAGSERLQPEALEALALERRAELQSLKEQYELARRKVNARGGRRVPNMDVTLQYSLVGEGDNFDSSMELDETRIGVGLSMDFNIAGTVNDEPQRLAIGYRARERAYQRLQSEIRSEVRTALFAMREKATDLNLAREGLVIAQQQYRFAELRYAKGTASTEEVLEKEQELSDARQRELAARVEYLVSSYDVQRASGTLTEQWQR